MKKRHNYTGKEFKPGDTAKLHWGGKSISEVTVKGWTLPYGGWWYVQLDNGAMHYTQRLIVPSLKNWWDD